MDPDFDRRLQAARNEMLLAGMRPFQASPPLVRLLWSLGFRLRPPFYQRFSVNALISGAVFATLFGLIMHFRDTNALSLHWGGAVVQTMVAGVFFGLTMSSFTAWQAKDKGLSRWEDL